MKSVKLGTTTSSFLLQEQNTQIIRHEIIFLIL